MKALLCKKHGPPESLVLEEVPDLVPGPGEVVIAVHAAAANFPDTLIIENKYQFKPPLPFSPGGEVAGTIVAVGEGVVDHAVGDPVIGSCGWGGFAEQVKVPVRKLQRLPAGVAMDLAASLIMTYGTTHYALTDRAQLQPGETLLEASIREALEESACRFIPRHLVGIYAWRHEASAITYLRFAFCGDIDGFEEGRTLDKGILRAAWMSAAELRGNTERLRSPLVLRCVEDYAAGKRLPLDVIDHLV